MDDVQSSKYNDVSHRGWKVHLYSSYLKFLVAVLIMLRGSGVMKLLPLPSFVR